MSTTLHRKKKRKMQNQEKHKQKQFQQGRQVSIADVNEGHEISSNKISQTKLQNVRHSHKNIQQETNGQSFDPSLPQPYQFLRFRYPPIHTIFVPHFAIKSLNFGVTIILTLAFLTLIIYNYIKPQSGISWNCSLFQLQNKYYPRIRYNFQFWRVILSGLFHSNIAHFILNIIGIQIYGYFIEWYYGKVKYIITILSSIILSHFLGCIIQITTVSTMASSILFCFLALKVYFFYQYWAYKSLQTRKMFLYLLFVLILVVNIIPIFVSNNVDYSSYIGGLITGGLLGLTFYFQKKQKLLREGESIPILQRIIKFSCPVLLAGLIIACIAIIFIIDNEEYKAINNAIDAKCS